MRGKMKIGQKVVSIYYRPGGEPVTGEVIGYMRNGHEVIREDDDGMCVVNYERTHIPVGTEVKH